jgi:hypothetical protein
MMMNSYNRGSRIHTWVQNQKLMVTSFFFLASHNRDRGAIPNQHRRDLTKWCVYTLCLSWGRNVISRQFGRWRALVYNMVIKLNWGFRWGWFVRIGNIRCRGSKNEVCFVFLRLQDWGRDRLAAELDGARHRLRPVLEPRLHLLWAVPCKRNNG